MGGFMMLKDGGGKKLQSKFEVNTLSHSENFSYTGLILSEVKRQNKCR